MACGDNGPYSVKRAPSLGTQKEDSLWNRLHKFYKHMPAKHHAKLMPNMHSKCQRGLDRRCKS